MLFMVVGSTLIHLILPVRCVDKSGAEWNEDNKVRQWPDHFIFLSVFWQSLSVFTVSFSFTPLISSSISLSAFPLFYNADTSVQPFNHHCCAVSDVALRPITSEKPKSRTIKENLSQESSRGFSPLPTDNCYNNFSFFGNIRLTRKSLTS